MTQIGRYQIEKELGRGAMAVVYKGLDPLIGRVLAIKTIRIEGGLGQEPEQLRQRLYREAQSAGNLNHPNIVTIYDIGEDQGLAYIAMEFVEGESLEDWIARNPRPPVEQTLSIIEQIASGLDYAAARGITHRDIKPANILLTGDLRAKIADFGIAKFSMSKLTQTGAIIGTPAYMSPEQALGNDLDGRSDIFSLGIIFYEMVAGERPFGGTNPSTIIYKIVHEEPPPPRQLNATLHPGYEAVVRRMMAKDPAQRYQSCAEVIRDLKNPPPLGEPLEVTPPPAIAERKRRSYRAPLSVAVALFLLGCFGLYLYQGRETQVATASIPASVIQSKTALPAPAAPFPQPRTSPSVSADVPAEPATKPVEKEPVALPKPANAQLRVEYAGESYPATLFDGRKALGPPSSAASSIQVAAGEHQFRVVAENVYLNLVQRVRLKADQAYSISLPGLGSAYIEVPNDAYDGCEILLNGKQLPTPYPAQVPKLAAGEHRIVFRWSSGTYGGKEVASTIATQENHLYRVRGEPQTEKVIVQQVR